MHNWNFKVDKVLAQSNPYRAGEATKEGIVNISTDQETSAGEESVHTLQKTYPQLFTTLGETNALPVLVPMHSAWFSTEGVDDIEKRAFHPHLETEEGVKGYLHVRNRIFRMFQNNPGAHLSITQCRKYLTDDVSMIIKVYTFLEHWGLINYKVGVKRDIEAMLRRIEQKDLFNLHRGSASAELTHPENKVQVKMVTVGESTLPTPNTQPSTQQEHPDVLKDISKHHTLQMNGPRITSIPTVTNCTECHKEMNGLQGEENIYFSDRERIILCKQCFDGGRYPTTLSYSNFHLLEAGIIRQVWSVEEEMFLVEGIEMYKDDWHAVSSYVKTKTVEQCVLHFLKMGIQNPLVEMEAISFSVNKLPFNYTLNPVMSTVAFLASVVHPGVASEAAKAAVREIKRIADEKKKEEDARPWINSQLNEIAAVALSSCIFRAEEQKKVEEGKKERLLELLVESEMKRIEAKVAEFTELTQTLKKEREDLEKMRETYRKAHLDTRREISEIVSKVRKICEETGRNFEDIFFKEQQ
ncbi:SWI/SNF related-matrix-associated actin-dependent regulator of chromatin subfamily C [Nematocida displodere]|uniref:SWI/SNF related-matrix-associated actin-dependent regulator of chromatin subfamily C n=1 Tax=Nematocida displodere TaxID=1805483 RepID=A0A177EC66_9MICR|nr:SWI/SNF related-matrix-associated actin-dependent regulator of chromatin subfamily C [Nematocida displodere]